MQVLSTRLFGKTTDLKLKAITIIHSSTTETVRLPGVVAGANEAGVGTGAVVVHPIVVRSKLPLQRRIRHADSSSVQRKPHKKVIARKKKPFKTKKKSKDCIDYSAVKEKPLVKPSEEDPLGKVRNWLLNSHDISGSLAVRKSKSSPAGFLHQGHQSRSLGGKVHRPSEQRGSLDVNGKEQVKLQVVYKPPFKFCVKLKKPTEVATTVVKEINSKVNRRNRAAILIQNENKRKIVKAKRKTRPTQEISKETNCALKNRNLDSSDGLLLTGKLKINKEPVVPEANAMGVKAVMNNEPVYENTPIYQNLHEMSTSKVGLLRTSSVNCVHQSKAFERGNPQKIMRHHSVAGQTSDKPRTAQENNKHDSITTDKSIDSVRFRLPYTDNTKHHTDTSKRHSVPLLESDTDSNLHTMPSDLEVLLSESEYLFSDA